MTGYSYTIPNSLVHGVALRIHNTSTIVNGIYSGVGIFIDNGDGVPYPLITAGKDQLVDIPANSVIYVYEHFPTPLRFRENVRIVVDSTDLPNTCIMTPEFMLEVEDEVI